MVSDVLFDLWPEMLQDVPYSDRSSLTQTAVREQLHLLTQGLKLIQTFQCAAALGDIVDDIIEVLGACPAGSAFGAALEAEELQ